MKFHTKLATVLAVALTSFALFSFGGGSTRAADLFQDIDWNGSQFTGLTFQKFDPSRGTLVGVQYGIEIDAQWDSTYKNTGNTTGQLALSWDQLEEGYFPPTRSDIGTPGHSPCALQLSLPSAGLFSRTVSRPVELLTAAPGATVPATASVDTQFAWGPVFDFPGALQSVTGTGTFLLPINTTMTLENAGGSQSECSYSTAAQGVVGVRYLFVQ